MIGKLRWAYRIVAWLFIASVLVQVFLAGLALFAETSFELHVNFGFTAVHLLSLLLIPLAWRARAGRRAVWLSALLFVVVTVQVALPGLRAAVPMLAALHPMLALLIFWLGIHLARGADQLTRVPILAPARADPAPTGG